MAIRKVATGYNAIYELIIFLITKFKSSLDYELISDFFRKIIIFKPISLFLKISTYLLLLLRGKKIKFINPLLFLFLF